MQNASASQRIRTPTFEEVCEFARSAVEELGVALENAFKRRPRIGTYVRDLTGEVGQIVSYDEAVYGRVIVQFKPFGKGRHKDRASADWRGLAPLTEMEVLAEASR